MSSLKRKIRKMKKRLIQVAAYYRSDQLDGVGTILRSRDGYIDPEDVIEKLMKGYEEEWKSSKEDERKKIVEHYFGQLNHFASLRAEGKDKDMTLEESIICIINIWFLEKYKFLKSDEYNGCVFLYEAAR